MSLFNHPVISLGSPYGVGYEIFLRTVRKSYFKKRIIFAVGSKSILDFFIPLLKIKVKYFSIKTENELKDLKNKRFDFDFILFNIDKKAFLINVLQDITEKIDGRVALDAIKAGTELVKKDYFLCLVTLPVSKKNINLFDKSFIGHTEFIQKRWNEAAVFMTFVSKRINALLLTTHIPLSEVSENITPELVKNGIRTAEKLRIKLGLKKKICFLGLNPHAGENGLIGKEDLWIKKIIDKLRKDDGINIEGPLSSDSVFTIKNIKKFSIFISCYHDQALIPFKMLSFHDGVNLSFGMKHIRTSVDHGTAVGLIGKKKAKAGSFISAYKLAEKLS